MMDIFDFTSSADGTTIYGYRWPLADALGTVQIVHGLAEHARRYDRLATTLNNAGFDVWAHDHRGHGATAGPDATVVNFGQAGWSGLIADTVQFSALIAERSPGQPHFVVAHSMGSMAMQTILLDHSADYDGVVLSGTTAIDVFAQALVEQPADAPSDLSAFNAGFENRTGYEWLSRDDAEVDLYVTDVACGLPTEADVVPSLFSSSRVADPDSLAGIDRALPVLLVSGSDDPLAGAGGLIHLVANRYQAAGLTDVEVEIYPGARHEVFNETNRDEITQRVADWLLAHSSLAPRHP
jgi:alpha-beta hydrolase superfamily lysophospholipase